MDWNLFWVAFGSIGTTFGVCIAAISIFISLKPYKKQFVAKLGRKMTDVNPMQYFIEFYNAGETFYLSSIRYSYKKKVIFDYPFDDPVLFIKNNEFSHDLSLEEKNAISSYLINSKSRILDIYITDIQDKSYHNKMDVSWYKSYLDYFKETFKTL